ncbi:MAG TPA: tetratricopeptide repeat protein [Candidatus Limnocylindrales bacterium]
MSDGSPAAPPSTVTFLFTDIEGSSRLEQRVGTRAYAPLRERHRELLRAAFEAEGGREQGTAGDSFFVVFPTAAGAIRAAVVAQRALAAEPWPDDAAIRVRIGIHTGEAERSGDDFVGIDINRAARIEAAANGGQIVVSDATRGLAEGRLDSEFGFTDLGSHRLKDFEPLHLHQVTAPGLAAISAPLRSQDGRLINFTPPVTSFIGRAVQLAEVRAVLPTVRLLTLTGPGGTGKTRLSIEAAHAALGEFPGGVAWVGLSPIEDPALVPNAIATVLGVLDDGTRDVALAIAERIGGDRMLLVLDNFEQVMPAAGVVGTLLARCPELAVLVTSREILHLAGEHEYPVPSLDLPDAAAAADPAILAHNEAAALFVERAQAVRPDFRLGPDNVAAVAAICARLDGLPLAIELAAARVRILAPAALLARLEQSLGILAGGARDLPARQQTLRGAIAWSYDLLSAAEQTLFDRLAVFAGGWSIDAATVVTDPDGGLGLDPLDGLSSLVEKSLIRGLEAPGGEPRFRMLQTIREFGLERLAATSEVTTLRDRHLNWIADLVQAAEPELVGPDTKRWLDELELEHDNIRTALRWALEAGHVEIGLLTAGRAWRFWHQRGHLGEGLAMTRDLLDCPQGKGRTTGRAKALNGAGGLAYWQNDFASAEGFYSEQLDIFEELGDRAGLAEAHYNLGYLEAVPGHHDLAVEHYERALELWRELGDENGEASGRLGLALVLFLQQDYERSIRVAREALVSARKTRDRYRIASILGVIGRALGELGDRGEAEYTARAALALFAEVGDSTGVSLQFDDLGDFAFRDGQPARALQLAGAAATLRERLAGGAPPTLVRHGDYQVEARKALSPEEAEAAWQAGKSMDEKAAVADALGDWRPIDGRA